MRVCRALFCYINVNKGKAGSGSHRRDAIIAFTELIRDCSVKYFWGISVLVICYILSCFFLLSPSSRRSLFRTYHRCVREERQCNENFIRARVAKVQKSILAVHQIRPKIEDHDRTVVRRDQPVRFPLGSVLVPGVFVSSAVFCSGKRGFLLFFRFFLVSSTQTVPITVVQLFRLVHERFLFLLIDATSMNPINSGAVSN
jgi:hypothetical protein